MAKTEYQEEYILSLIYQLPVENQMRLALTILQEIESNELTMNESPEMEEELFRRIKEYECGDVKGRPWKEALDAIRQRLKTS